MFQLGTSKEMMFADAFTLQLVEFEDLQNCNYVLGMIPTLQKFAKDVSRLCVFGACALAEGTHQNTPKSYVHT